MNSFDYIINNIEVINEGKRQIASVFIKDGRIEKISETTSTSSQNIIDGTGLILIPGVIDDQVHFRDPGLTHKGDIFSESTAALAGGVTSYMEMPNTLPQTTSIAELNRKHENAYKNSLVNFSFYLGATNDNIAEIEKVDVSNTCGIKVFMGSSTGNMLVDNKEVLSTIFKYSPVLVATHCEDDNIIKKNLAEAILKFPNGIPYWMHPKIRDAEACYKSSSLAVELASKYKSRLHVLHISTAKELELFKSDIIENKRITSEVCIHHLIFNDSDYEKKGALIKWNPSVKYKDDQLALLEGLKNNRIDVVATDHAPHTFEEKQRDYVNCPSGGPMVQHSLVSMLELCRQGLLSEELVVEKMCHAPAKLFNIDKRGFIRPGYWADLVIIDPNSPFLVNDSNILYKCKWSPLSGHSFGSSIKYTFVNGKPAFSNGKIDFENRGTALKFNR